MNKAMPWFSLDGVRPKFFFALTPVALNEASHDLAFALLSIPSIHIAHRQKDSILKTNQNTNPPIPTTSNRTTMVQPGVNSVLSYGLLSTITVLCLVFIFALIKFRQNLTLKKQLSEESLKLEQKSIQLDQLELNIAILSDIGEEISGSLDFDEILDTLYLRINQLMDASIFLIGLYDEEAKGIDFKLTIENGEHQPLFVMSLDEKDRPAVWCIDHQEPLVINDYAKEHEAFFGNVAIPVPKSGEGTESVIYWPLFVGGKVMGVMSVQSYRKNAYTRQHQDMISYLASTAAIALDNAKTYLKIEQQKTALEKANERVRVISEIGLQVNASLDMNHILLQLYDSVNTLMDAPIFGIGLHDVDNNVIDVRMNVEYGTRYKPYIRDMNDKSRFSVWCIDHCKIIYINDLDTQGHDYIANHEYETPHWVPLEAGNELESKIPQSLIYIPLLMKNRVIGTLSVQSAKKQAFDPVHVDILTSLASFTAPAIENARIYQDLLSTQEHLEAANKNVHVVSEIGQQVNASLNLEAVLFKIYNSVNSLMDAPVFGVGLYVPEANRIDIKMAVEYGTRYKPYTRDMNDKHQFPVWCIDHQKTIYINDLDKEDNVVIALFV